MANFSFTGLQTGVSFQDTTESQPTSISNVNPDLSVMTNRAISSGTPLNVSFPGIITGVDIAITSQSFTLNGTPYPVRGFLWVPTSLSSPSIDVVVCYHGSIDLGTTTISQAAQLAMNIMKNNVNIKDKIIFSVAYPQGSIDVTQNINLLTVGQLSTFRFGDNLPYARSALKWAKNNLNSFMSSNGISKIIDKVYMFGHSQGGSLVHKLNTLEITNGVIANAPGPIRLDETCAAVESIGGTDITCSKLFSAYGTASATPLSSNEYYLRSVFNYTTGHLAPITYLQALDDTTGYVPGVDGQVVWMSELISAMNANNQNFKYYTVPNGGHDAFVFNTIFHDQIKSSVNSSTNILKAAISSWNTGRRPTGGMLYPR